MAAARDLERRILDTALAIAAERGWARVRLRQVADRLDLPLGEIRRRYPDLDAVGNAIFRQADGAMLDACAAPGFAAEPARARIFRAIIAWLDALAPHRPAVAAMLGYKLRPSHLHLQAGLAVGLSRTVQWLREGAGLDAAGRRKEVEEIGLSLLFVATFALWLTDRSAGQARTRGFLERRLAAADRLMVGLYGARPSVPDEPPPRPRSNR